MNQSVNDLKFDSPPLSIGQALIFEIYYNIPLDEQETIEICYVYFLFILSLEYRDLPPIFGTKEREWLLLSPHGIPNYQYYISKFYKISQQIYVLDHGSENFLFDFIASNSVNYKYFSVFVNTDDLLKKCKDNLFTNVASWMAVDYIPNFLQRLYAEREDLKDFFSKFKNEYRVLLLWWLYYGFDEFFTNFNSRINKKEHFTSIYNPDMPKGINVLGFVGYEFAIGEDARLAYQALSSCQNTCVVEPPIDIPSRHKNTTLQRVVSTYPKYKTNIVYFPANEHLSLYLKYYNSFFKNKFTICNWQWELPFWPKPLNYCFNLADEIWAPTTYIQRSIDSAGRQKAILMPMAVHIPSFKKYEREYFKINKKKFVFLYIFDSLSWFQRKNPYACIESFKLAFHNSKDVTLIIKTMNFSNTHPFFSYISRECEKDPRIMFINKCYSRDEILSLYSCCDAYVSLHRAEGFGRTIAEAMLLGLPVVVSNFSGNCDFCNNENSFLVAGTLINLKKTDYIHSEGQYWYDVSIDDAADKMKLCYSNELIRSKFIINAKKKIVDLYSLEVVSRAYISRLNELGCI